MSKLISGIIYRQGVWFHNISEIFLMHGISYTGKCTYIVVFLHTQLITLLQLSLVRTSTKRNIWVFNPIKSIQDYVEMYYEDPILRSTIKTNIFAEVIRFYALVKGRISCWVLKLIAILPVQHELIVRDISCTNNCYR